MGAGRHDILLAMPDFYPLYNTAYSPARRVFDQNGKPVFARIRMGSVTIPLSLSGSVALVAGTAPAGSTSFSPSTASLPRVNYKTFTTSETEVDQSWVSIGSLGGNAWYMRCWYSTLGCGYWNSSTGFRIHVMAGVQRAYKSGSNYVVWDGAYTIFTLNHDATNKLLPDGGYTASTYTYTYGNCTISIGSTLTAGFTES